MAAVNDMQGIDIRTAMATAKSLYTLNSRNEILSDIKVREAIMAGIDRSTLSEIRFNGLNGYTEDLPGSFNLYQTQEGYEDNVGAVIAFDPEKDGKKLSVRNSLLGDSSTGKAQTTATQKMMKDIGVDLARRATTRGPSRSLGRPSSCVLTMFSCPC
nr:ABC transporter substrate-binding protein [Corynebacterium sp.]